MAKDTPVLLTSAGRKRVVVEETVWEGRTACLPLPAASRGKGQGLSWESLARFSSALWNPFVLLHWYTTMPTGQHSPSTAHSVRTFCSDCPALAVTAFQDGAWLTGMAQPPSWHYHCLQNPLLLDRKSDFSGITLILLPTSQGVS